VKFTKSIEPISFKCDGCGKVSEAQMEFQYAEITKVLREWILTELYERSECSKACQHCGLLQWVWPTHHVEKRWERRYG
jgi:hypothetical protein